MNSKDPYSSHHGKTPITRYPGSKTIAFNLTTARIQVMKSRYTAKSSGVGDDHREMLIEVSYVSAIGTTVPKVVQPKVNRINL